MSNPRPTPALPEAALAAILRGDAEQGFALYQQSFDRDHLPGAPVGLHVAFLEQSGRHKEAARLRQLGVEHGASLALKAGSIGAEPAVAAAELEALFERGIVNMRMVYDYLKLLVRLGRMDDHARWLASDHLIRLSSLEQDSAAVDALLMELEAGAERQQSVQSVRDMRMVPGLSDMMHPVAESLLSAMGEITTAYLADWRRSDHPLARHVPRQFRIRAWGLINRGAGHNIPHIHPKGWATGVYYPRSPIGGGGELVIGAPRKGPGTESDWGGRTIRPVAGLLVLMPSFVTHWTVPLDRSGLRTSIAFDVLGADCTADWNGHAPASGLAR